MFKTQNFEMNPLTSMTAAAAVIGASLIAVSRAEVRNEWMHYGNHDDGTSSHVKVISRNGHIVETIVRNSKDGDFYIAADCSRWMYKFRGDAWTEVIPGSFGEIRQKLVCR